MPNKITFHQRNVLNKSHSWEQQLQLVMLVVGSVCVFVAWEWCIWADFSLLNQAVSQSMINGPGNDN